MEKNKCSAHKLHWERFWLYIRGKYLTVRTINHWNYFPQDVVDSLVLETFKVQIDKVLDNLCLGFAFTRKGWTQCSLWSFSTWAFLWFYDSLLCKLYFEFLFLSHTTVIHRTPPIHAVIPFAALLLTFSQGIYMTFLPTWTFISL